MERFMTLDESVQRYMLGCFTFDVHASLREIGAVTFTSIDGLVNELERVLDAPSSPDVVSLEPAPPIVAPEVTPPPKTTRVDKRRRAREPKPVTGLAHSELADTADATS